MAHGKHSGTGLYITVAIILAVITYLEYAIVEFPPTWMSSGWVLFWVVLMSVAKFWMVIWFFMHLRDDPKLYTGFFSSGMVIGVGTFVVLIAMFILPRAVAPVMMNDVMVADVSHGGHYGGPTELSDEQRALIESDGASRSQAERAQTPRPRDGALVVTPPAASTNGFSVRSQDAAATQDPAAQAESEADSEAAATEAEAEADGPVTAEAPDMAVFDTELGASTYMACAGCHQSTGEGIAGAFPPLAGHAADLYRAEGGRPYLIGVLLYGVQGQIVVDGASYNGLMPAFSHYDDAAIAAVLNHIVTAWGNDERIDAFEAFTVDEVEAERGQGLSPADMYQRRQALVFASDAPAEPEPAAAEEPAESAEETSETVMADGDEGAEASASADPTFDTALGASTYSSCVGCHQPSGAGVPGAFPPLVGHAADLYAADGGRTYLVEMMLYGVRGEIVVDGTTYNGVMPGWQQLSDEAIAAVINHTLTEWGNADAIDDFDAVRADEVAAARGQGLSAADVYERRSALGLD